MIAHVPPMRSGGLDCAFSSTSNREANTVHHHRWKRILLGEFTNADTHHPRVLRVGYWHEQRTLPGTECVLPFLFASDPSSAHEKGARVCARQSETLPLCEHCGSQRFHWTFTYNALTPFSCIHGGRVDSQTSLLQACLEWYLGAIPRHPRFP
jgi:hypothetical protein